MTKPFNQGLMDRVEVLHYMWRSFTRFGLSERYVPGEGRDSGAVAFIFGAAPGATDDLKLRPFVGGSGLILRELMASAGLHTGFTPHFGESNAWLTNVVKFRLPGNKTPDDAMINDVRDYLRLEWQAVGMPQVIIPVGEVALRALLGENVSILTMAGKLTYVDSVHARPQRHAVWPMMHPSFAVKEERLRPLIEKDWHHLGRWLLKEGHVK